jgi:hypothetical protein
MVAVQYISTGLINMQYFCDGTRAHTAVTSLSVLFKQNAEDVFFTTAVSVHCQMLPGILFLLNLPE